MKQYITLEQLAELSPTQHTAWREWLESKGIYGQTHLMSNIGMMIEFLQESKNIEKITSDPSEYFQTNRRFRFWEEESFCDALWEAVKQVLENE